MDTNAGQLMLDTEVVPVAADQEPSLLAVIAQATINPHVQIDKMQALLDMKERIDEREAKRLFNLAMIDAQAEMRPIVRDRNNEHTKSKYATLQAVDKAIRPIYTKHGFALTFGSREAREGMLTVTCECLHRGGYSKEYELTGALDSTGPSGTKNKTGIQATGSSDQYLRRYLTTMIFNLVTVDEDNDGNSEPQFINSDQISKISDMIMACEMDAATEAKFCALLNAKAVEQILACNYEVAMTQLRAKYRAKGGR